jgi:hypothetical protein
MDPTVTIGSIASVCNVVFVASRALKSSSAKCEMLALMVDLIKTDVERLGSPPPPDTHRHLHALHAKLVKARIFIDKHVARGTFMLWMSSTRDEDEFVNLLDELTHLLALLQFNLSVSVSPRRAASIFASL